MGQGLQIEDELALLSFANPNFLFRYILKPAFGYADDVVLELEIRYAQLPILRELRLRFAVEKHSCLVLTSDDNQRTQVAGSCFFGAGVWR